MDTKLLVDKIITIENILLNNEGKNDNMIKFGWEEIKTLLLNNPTHKDDSGGAEIKRLNKIIEEKDSIINKLTSELNSLKMNNKSSVKLGCQHFKTVNVFVKCSICKDFFSCYQCHNTFQNHKFKGADIIKCRFCNTIYENNLSSCPGCNVEKKLS